MKVYLLNVLHGEVISHVVVITRFFLSIFPFLDMDNIAEKGVPLL